MKKILLALVLTVTAAVTTFADESFAYGVWFNSPKETTTANISGFGLGVPVIAFKNLSGTSVALFANASEQTSGFQCALGFNDAQSLDGVQLAPINLQSGEHGDFSCQIGCYNQAEERGVQIGVVNNSRNNARFQFGLINVNRNGLWPVMILVNFSKDAFN